MTDFPDWMFQHIQDARELFGLGGPEWHIVARLSDKPGGDKDNSGTTWPDSTYLNATIELEETLPDNDTGKSLIYHEVLHITHDEIDQIVTKAIDCLPRTQRDLFRELYREAVERYMQRMSRSIVAGLTKEEGEDVSG